MQADFGVRLPATVIIDCPTIAALAEHIASLHHHGQAQSTRCIRPSLRHTASGHSPALAIGPVVSCGQPQTQQILGSRHNLDDGRAALDAVGLTPLDRWDVELEAVTAGRSLGGSVVAPPRFGAFISCPGVFEPAPFGLSTAEAALMDPQQRLLLDCVAEAAFAASSELGVDAGACLATCNAGVTAAATLRAGGNGHASSGVFVGIASSDYGTLLRQHTSAGSFHATACAPSVASGRVSFTFGFGGPSISVGVPGAFPYNCRATYSAARVSLSQQTRGCACSWSSLHASSSIIDLRLRIGSGRAACMTGWRIAVQTQHARRRWWACTWRGRHSAPVRPRAPSRVASTCSARRRQRPTSPPPACCHQPEGKHTVRRLRWP